MWLNYLVYKFNVCVNWVGNADHVTMYTYIVSSYLWMFYIFNAHNIYIFNEILSKVIKGLSYLKYQSSLTDDQTDDPSLSI